MWAESQGAHACRWQVLLHAPSPSFYAGGLVSPWILAHWDTIKTATVVPVVTYPLVLSLALMQVRELTLHHCICVSYLWRCGG